MNEDAKMHEPKMANRVWENDRNVTFENACREEKTLASACHNDNRNNQSLCKEIDNEVVNCMRYYGKFFPTNIKDPN